MVDKRKKVKKRKVCKHYQPYSIGYCNLTKTDRQCPNPMEKCNWYEHGR